MTSNQFSIRLHEARKMMGLSMEKLAELTGGIITKQSISLPSSLPEIMASSPPSINGHGMPSI